MRYIAFALMVLSCQPSRPPVTETRVSVNVCARYRELGCPTGEPTPSGVTCEQVFENAREAGIVMDASPECVAAATTCQALDRC